MKTGEQFFDNLSERLYDDLCERKHSSGTSSRVMLEFSEFNIAESYVTSKVVNKKGDIVKVNIEGGRQGIDLQETLFDLRGKKPAFAYLITAVKNDNSATGSK